MFFSRGRNLPLLPPPTWHLTFIFLQRPYPSHSSWVHNTVDDGDVESNPGPSTLLPFPEFLKTEYDNFAPVIPAMDMARQSGNLRARLRATSENFQQAVDDLTNQFGPTPDGEDIIRVLSAYELFTQSTLVKSDNMWVFQTPSSEIDLLRQEIAQLKVTATSQSSSSNAPSGPTFDTLKGLSLDNATTFLSLPALPTWMQQQGSIFRDFLSSPDSHSATATLQDLWTQMVQTYFKYSAQYGTHRQAGGRQSRHTYNTLCYEEALQKGGKVVMETTAKGMCSFIYLGDIKYYVATHSGRLYDVNRPPPPPTLRGLWQTPLALAM